MRSLNRTAKRAASYRKLKEALTYINEYEQRYAMIEKKREGTGITLLMFYVNLSMQS